MARLCSWEMLLVRSIAGGARLMGGTMMLSQERGYAALDRDTEVTL